MIVQVYMDSAPEWVGRQHPDALFVSSNGAGDPPRVLAGLLPRSRGRGRRRLGVLRGARAPRRREPGVRRLRPVERAARHQLGEPDLHRQPRVLLLPQHRRPLPRVAEEEVRHARGAERGVVPPLRVVGRGGAEPAQHDPLLHRLHRLEALHRRQARRGPARALRGCEARRARARSPPATRRASACSRRPTTGRGSRTTGRWPSRSTTTGPPSIPSTRRSWTARSSGAARCSTSRARSASRAGVAASGSASCRPASAPSRSTSRPR